MNHLKINSPIDLTRCFRSEFPPRVRTRKVTDSHERLRRIRLHLPPKPRKFYDDIVTGKVFRAIVKTCRGGGKSWTAAGIEFTKWADQSFDWFNLGGSETQAKIVYTEVGKSIDLDQDVAIRTVKNLQSEILHQDGQRIVCAAASTKQTRGGHAGGLDRKSLTDEEYDTNDFGSKEKGGGLTIDEECEAEEEVVLSALPIVNTAKPSVIIRMSTFHKAIGTFQKTWDNAPALGYTRYEWDIFDVCEPCKENCNQCFKEFREKYCKGKAKKSVGWVAIAEIKQAWRECEENRQWFEVEYMGWKPSGAGLVYPLEAIDKAIVDRVSYIQGCPTFLGIDWGYSLNRTCFIILQFQGQERHVLHCEYLTAPTLSECKKRATELHELFPFDYIYPDSSHPYNNNELLFKFKVQPVVFSTQKETGISNVLNGFEHGWYKIPKEFTKLIEQLKNYRKDKNGKPVKENDHGCDALLCASEPVKPNFDFKKVNEAREEEEAIDEVENFPRQRIGSDI